MNFLAHAFLSNNEDHILIGNIITDLIQKSDEVYFSPKILNGIYIHRMIDSFTDAHPEVRHCVKLLRPNHKKYAPVVMDLLWDLILAENWNQYSKNSLRSFIDKVYLVLESNFENIPLKVQEKLNFLIKKDFLFMYSNVEGMKMILEKVQLRTKFSSNFPIALNDYEEHKQEFTKSFNVFFPALIQHLKSLKN